MKKTIHFLILLIFGFSGMMTPLTAQLSVKYLGGIPDVVAPGAKHDLSIYIHNDGSTAFTGIIQLRFEINGSQTSPGQPLVNVTVAPNDSILWQRLNYNFPNGMMQTGYNTVVVWPTSPQISSDGNATVKTVLYTAGAAFKMRENHVAGIQGAIANQSVPTNINLTTKNIGLNMNQNDTIDFYLTLNDQMDLLLSYETGGVNPLDSISTTVFGFWLGKIIDDYWYPQYQAPVTKLTFWANERSIQNSIGGADFTIEAPTGIFADDLAEDLFSVFPNPANNFLRIDMQDRLKGKVQEVNILNLAGQTLLKKGMFTDRLEIGNLPNGMYIVEVITDEQKATRTFVKE